MAESRAITDWKRCVALAKLRNGISKNTYVLLKGKILKEAQKYYCAMGY